MSVVITKAVNESSDKRSRKFTANIEIFESAMEVVRTCKDRRITDSSFDDMREKSMRESWHGVKSYEEALSLLNSGWSEKLKELKEVADKCTATQNDKRITFKNDVHGFAPIVPLAILGIPNSMINTAYRPIKSKVVSIYYDVTINCGNDAEQLVKNGRKVVEAVMKLENMGYRVNLFVVQGYTRDHDGDMLAIKVKSANQPLDLKRLCFPVMNAAMFRVIGFDWYSKFPKGKYRSGYGTNIDATLGTATANTVMKNLFGEDAVYLLATQIQDKDVEYIIETLKGGNK